MNLVTSLGGRATLSGKLHLLIDLKTEPVSQGRPFRKPVFNKELSRAGGVQGGTEERARGCGTLRGEKHAAQEKAGGWDGPGEQERPGWVCCAQGGGLRAGGPAVCVGWFFNLKQVCLGEISSQKKKKDGWLNLVELRYR